MRIKGVKREEKRFRRRRFFYESRASLRKGRRFSRLALPRRGVGIRLDATVLASWLGF